MIYETGFWSQELHDKGHAFSYRLAQQIAQILPKSERVYDYGCGIGSYLRYLHDIGFKSVYGFDGIIPSNNEISNIGVQDLTEPMVGMDRGNTLCLEVGEHIPEEHLGTFFDNITKNCLGICILSFGVPNQGGDGHVSCRPNIWVVGEMTKRGFELDVQASMDARSVVENHVSWFRESFMVYRRKK